MTALLLARDGWSVAVLEKATFPRSKVCGEFVSPASRSLLRELGLDGSFVARAGPPVRRVAVYAGAPAIEADLPRQGEAWSDFGRALSRDELDAWLLDEAQQAGAEVWQPYEAIELSRGDVFTCTVRHHLDFSREELRASAVIAAHGSWEPGNLPTQLPRRAATGRDLLGFKAHFRAVGLASDLMPLLAFPGGYGGMVHSNRGRLSLSCCIERRWLDRCRRERPAASAGETVLAHILRFCPEARKIPGLSEPESSWLAMGPVRPGLRTPFRDGVFCVGNTAGEAHPVIADGISMAMQGAHFLAVCLRNHGRRKLNPRTLRTAGDEYSRVWTQTFAPRIRASRLFAFLASRPRIFSFLLLPLRRYPSIISHCARQAGKGERVVAVS